MEGRNGNQDPRQPEDKDWPLPHMQPESSAFLRQDVPRLEGGLEDGVTLYVLYSLIGPRGPIIGLKGGTKCPQKQKWLTLTR